MCAILRLCVGVFVRACALAGGRADKLQEGVEGRARWRGERQAAGGGLRGGRAGGRQATLRTWFGCHLVACAFVIDGVLVPLDLHALAIECGLRRADFWCWSLSRI